MKARARQHRSDVDRPLRVLLAVTIDDSLQFLSGFPEELVRRGCEVHVVSTPGPRLSRLASEVGITVHGIDMHRSPNPLHDIGALIRWVLLVRQVRPDVTYVGTPKAGLLGTIATWIVGVPRRIYVLRGLRLETVSGVGRRVLAGIERLVMRLSTHVVAVSHGLRDVALSMRLAPPEKIVVIGAGSSNGVDVARFAPDYSADQLDAIRTEFGLAQGLPIVGFVGRLTHDKGLSVLSGALRQLEASGRHVQLLVVGGVDDDSGERGLRELTATGASVVATGYQPDTARLFRVMTVLCHPSLREGFVNVVLEASASGIPVVGSDATGVSDAILDGVSGLVVPRGDSSSLAEALWRVVSDPDLTTILGTQGRAWVEANFARPLVQSRYADMITGVVDEARTL